MASYEVEEFMKKDEDKMNHETDVKTVAKIV